MAWFWAHSGHIFRNDIVICLEDCMQRSLIIATAITIVMAFSSPPAVAGDWSGSCGGCMFDGYAGGTTQIAPPSYVYAPPTVTIVPQYVVQPNIVIRRTYVFRPTRVLEEAAVPCMSRCGGGYVVDQGQFFGRPAPYQPSDVVTDWRAPDRYYLPGLRRRVYGYSQHHRLRYGYHRSRHYHRFQ